MDERQLARAVGDLLMPALGRRQSTDQTYTRKVRRLRVVYVDITHATTPVKSSANAG